MEGKKEFVVPQIKVIQFEMVNDITTNIESGIELPDHEWE